MKPTDERPLVVELVANLKTMLPTLRQLYEKYSDHWNYEDGIYRFYHQSFKVYRLQAATEEIVAALKALSSEPLNEWFAQIIAEGTGKQFSMEVNSRWLAETRPIVEAFFHARFMLEMAVRYGAELEKAPSMLPSGWAAFLYLYNLR